MMDGGSAFQFHKGTIRTFISSKGYVYCELFQFHKGTIRTPVVVARKQDRVTNFNSIKVQLEPGKFYIKDAWVK